MAPFSNCPDADVRATVKLLISMLNGTIYIKDAIARARLADLMQVMAAGALRGVGVAMPDNLGAP